MCWCCVLVSVISVSRGSDLCHSPMHQPGVDLIKATAPLEWVADVHGSALGDPAWMALLSTFASASSLICMHLSLEDFVLHEEHPPERRTPAPNRPRRASPTVSSQQQQHRQRGTTTQLRYGRWRPHRVLGVASGLRDPDGYCDTSLLRVVFSSLCFFLCAQRDVVALSAVCWWARFCFNSLPPQLRHGHKVSNMWDARTAETYAHETMAKRSKTFDGGMVKSMHLSRKKWNSKRLRCMR